MTARASGSVPLPLRVVLIGCCVAAAAAAIAGFDSAAAKRALAAPGRPPVARRAAPDEPIAAEALVFRTRLGGLAADTVAPRRAEAHPRTLATYRGLRAYPGAPPRVPHGLTAAEFRTTGCGTCHERGGYSARFAAYTPVSPHPELADCLQCHVPDAAVLAVDLPGPDPDDVCRQCHAPGARAASAAPLDWRAPEWPALRRRTADGTPPPIPHDLALRGDCNACHMGPAAVAEIRTRHPERADCRQCHVEDGPGDGPFDRAGGEP